MVAFNIINLKSNDTTEIQPKTKDIRVEKLQTRRIKRCLASKAHQAPNWPPQYTDEDCIVSSACLGLPSINNVLIRNRIQRRNSE